MKGLLMKEPLFIKTIEGAKTETRRLLKVKKWDDESKIFEAFIKNEFNFTVSVSYTILVDGEIKGGTQYIKPRFEKGEIVYLKEPYFEFSEGVYLYKYGVTGFDKTRKFKNKMFMPETAARYFIKIIDVRFERLKDITIDGIKKEGIRNYNNERTMFQKWESLWNSLSGKKHRYNSNPFVWVYEFELTIKEK